MKNCLAPAWLDFYGSPVWQSEQDMPPKSPVWPNRLVGAALIVIGLVALFGGRWLLKSSSHPTASAA